MELKTKIEEAKKETNNEVKKQMAETKFQKIQQPQNENHWEALAEGVIKKHQRKNV